MTETIVAKFGGSSMADAAQFQKVKEIVEASPARRYVVPSAAGKRHPDDHKVTDLLYMCQQLASHGIDPQEVFQMIRERLSGVRDDLGLQIDIERHLEEAYERIIAGASPEFVASRGEYLTGLLLADYLGIPFVDAADVVVFDQDDSLDAKATAAALAERLADLPRAVIPGFYGATRDGEVRTFSRGGSDVTGAVVASGVDADLYENWTDVAGFLKADPRVVSKPTPIERVTYKELRELAYMGAPVLHEESIFPVRAKGIPIRIRNTNRREDPGTLIVDDRYAKGFEGITGIAGRRNFTAISVEKTLMDDEHGFFRKLVSVFETNGISIAHMPSGIDSVTVLVATEDIQFSLDKVIAELKIYLHPDTVTVEDGIALLAIVGRGMISTPGVAAGVFGGLANAGVNARIITQGASELSIVVGVSNPDFERAIAAIYDSDK